ncbi:MAG: hypothetical protein EAZ57_02405 [Cytophagales bacterium]|nr:MAG: hypothetical protein EAZ67_02865 [Cytophagales bacterium]TAF61618.1 MAG: hypothetical protein EAZ57_02405 [Cytophagales bacterium]
MISKKYKRCLFFIKRTLFLTFLIAGIHSEMTQGIITNYYRADTYCFNARVLSTFESYIIVHKVDEIEYRSRFGMAAWSPLEAYAKTYKPLRIKYEKNNPGVLYPIDVANVKYRLLVGGIVLWICILVIFPWLFNRPINNGFRRLYLLLLSPKYRKYLLYKYTD